MEFIPHKIIFLKYWIVFIKFNSFLHWAHRLFTH
jgi:hypothetical protein